MSADKDARIAELESRNKRIEDCLVHERTRVADLILTKEELERKLAEQQAVWGRLWYLVDRCGAIVQDFSKRKILFDHLEIPCVYDLVCSLSLEIRQLSNRTDCAEELNNLLAKAKEDGRKEAVPEGAVVIPVYDLTICDCYRLGLNISDVQKMAESVSPKPQGETG